MFAYSNPHEENWIALSFLLEDIFFFLFKTTKFLICMYVATQWNWLIIFSLASKWQAFEFKMSRIPWKLQNCIVNYVPKYSGPKIAHHLNMSPSLDLTITEWSRIVKNLYFYSPRSICNTWFSIRAKSQYVSRVVKYNKKSS